MEEEGEERGGEGRNWYDSSTDRILNNNDGRWFINVNNSSKHFGGQLGSIKRQLYSGPFAMREAASSFSTTDGKEM